MRDKRGFTLLELAILIVILIVIVGVLIPALGGSRPAPKMKNGTQLTAITKCQVLYADDHNGRFPQLGIGTTTGDTASARFQELTTKGSDPLGSNMLINPKDQGKQLYSGQGSLTTANFSYALLAAHSPEWRNNFNARAPIACDRLVGPGSIWNAKQWEGSVAWGDTHVTYENSRTMRTEMWDMLPAGWNATQPSPGSTTQPARTVRPADDIFSASDGGATMEYN